MRMRSGDVIDLDRRAGEPIDVWVNNRLIARGEVVLTDGLLGVALTEMVRQAN
jgi:flagellar motor switch protein FliN/FliY